MKIKWLKRRNREKKNRVTSVILAKHGVKISVCISLSKQ